VASKSPVVEYRRAVPSDAEAFVVLMRDEEVFAGLLQMPYPTPEMWRARLEKNATDETGLHLAAVAGGRVIGSAGIHPTSPRIRQRHCAGFGISVAPDWQGKGIAGELTRRVLDWSDRWVGYLRVELTVYTDNDRAIALYRRHGFLVEGTMRAAAMRAGRYVDVLLMARLHPDPPQLPRG
jgi:putative acetyltransferase